MMSGTYKDSPEFVQHPMAGGIQPLHVLLGPAHHVAYWYKGRLHRSPGSAAEKNELQGVLG